VLSLPSLDLLVMLLFLLVLRLPPISTLFPYTTLFRSSPGLTTILCCTTRPLKTARTIGSSWSRPASWGKEKCSPPPRRCPDDRFRSFARFRCAGRDGRDPGDA